LSSILIPKNLKIKIHRTVIVFVVYVTVKLSHSNDKHGLGVFKNKVLRKTFGPKRYEIRGEWRNWRNEELHDWN